MNIERLTAQELLAIETPERLFKEQLYHKQFHTLARLWHPDRNKKADADKVMAHVSLLHDLAKAKISSGTWEVPGEWRLTEKNGETHTVFARIRRPFELGEFGFGNGHAAWLIKDEFNDLAANALRRSGGAFSFANDAMKADLKPRLPFMWGKMLDGYQMLITVEKGYASVPLRDALPYFPLDYDVRGKSVAWIVSELLNIACYLAWKQWSHNAITLDNVFIAPDTHQCFLLGGWWYHTPWNEKLVALPPQVMSEVPLARRQSKEPDPRMDLWLIRALARELLGDRSGQSLSQFAKYPQAMLAWLRSPPAASAYEDYNNWVKDVLPASFGPRRFTKLEINPSDIYKE